MITTSGRRGYVLKQSEVKELNFGGTLESGVHVVAENFSTRVKSRVK